MWSIKQTKAPVPKNFTLKGVHDANEDEKMGGGQILEVLERQAEEVGFHLAGTGEPLRVPE